MGTETAIMCRRHPTTLPPFSSPPQKYGRSASLRFLPQRRGSFTISRTIRALAFTTGIVS